MQKSKEEMYFAYHGSLDNPKSVGTNILIKEGAKIVTSPQDIIANYPFLKKISNLKKKEIIEVDENVPEEYKEIYKALSKDAKDLNELAKNSNLPLNEIMSKLTMLELEGKVEKLPGNKYKKM